MRKLEDKFNILIEHIIDIKTEQSRQGEQIDRNSDDLADHIEGVRQNRLRIEMLEKGKERVRGAVKFIGFAASIAAGIVAVYSAISKYL